jgi:outer membrane protein W
MGYHWNDWVSIQARYFRNRNQVISTEVSGGAFHQSDASSTQSTAAAEVLVYFRPRASQIRPYLSAGPAWVQFHLPNGGRQSKLGWPVAVGVDIALRKGWGVRYTFSETMSGNPWAAQLKPPTQSILMNFQNLVGFVKVFGAKR